MSKRGIVAFFSVSSNTKRVAEEIQAQTGSDICEIRAKQPYPTDYRALVQQARQEIEADTRPEIEIPCCDFGQYDVIYIGSPNWCGTIAPPISTFLSTTDLRGKTIAPFVTHGGGGAGRALEHFKRLCQNSKIGNMLAVQGGKECKALVSQWLSALS